MMEQQVIFEKRGTHGLIITHNETRYFFLTNLFHSLCQSLSDEHTLPHSIWHSLFASLLIRSLSLRLILIIIHLLSYLLILLSLWIPPWMQRSCRPGWQQVVLRPQWCRVRPGRKRKDRRQRSYSTEGAMKPTVSWRKWMMWCFRQGMIHSISSCYHSNDVSQHKTLKSVSCCGCMIWRLAKKNPIWQLATAH